MGKKQDVIKQVEDADIEVSRTASAFKDTAPVRALDKIGKMSDQPPLFAFAAGIAIAGLIRGDARTLRTAARMAAAHWLGMVAKDAVKREVDRTRPQMLIEEGRYGMQKGKSLEKALTSFPSGHTVGAVAVARALARDYPDLTAPAYATAGAAALSRIAACDHFASDTAAGAAIGWAAEAAVSAVLGRVAPRLAATAA